ncbi:uncharacterized protein LOC103749479 [Nannospalax galili]|uniref:uncharacterized protein LOC103749479 n=1 Tax=Nannospalax galili TaxID=1026970 RepID=UPI0004ED24F4|nr:uncharacterized protein LOC103749479 [Nannospalax galili]
MGGSWNCGRRRPVSGLLAAHIPPLSPHSAARVAAGPPHQAFPLTAPRRRPRGRGEEAEGGGADGQDGGSAAARCALGRPVRQDKDGDHCLSAAQEARTLGCTAHADPPSHPTTALPGPSQLILLSPNRTSPGYRTAHPRDTTTSPSLSLFGTQHSHPHTTHMGFVQSSLNIDSLLVPAFYQSYRMFISDHSAQQRKEHLLHS